MGGFHRGVLLATGRGRAEAIENLFNNRGGWLSQEAMVVMKPDKGQGLHQVNRTAWGRERKEKAPEWVVAHLLRQRKWRENGLQ